MPQAIAVCVVVRHDSPAQELIIDNTLDTQLSLSESGFIR